MRILLAALLLAMGLHGAQAQQACNSIAPFRHDVATGPVNIVPGIGGQRIYFCGFVLNSKAATLDFKVWTGVGATCTGGQDLSPIWSLPNGFALVSRVPTTGPSGNLGDGLCIQTFGTGSLTGVLYYTQF
jgi:hypothetical protein